MGIAHMGWRFRNGERSAGMMNNSLYPYLLFWGSVSLFCGGWLYPARPILYRSVLWRDLLALGLYNLSFLLVVRVTDRIPIPQYLPVVFVQSAFGGETGPVLRCRRFRSLLGASIVHTRLIWPVHRWHHSPTSLYWLAGFARRSHISRCSI